MKILLLTQTICMLIFVSASSRKNNIRHFKWDLNLLRSGLHRMGLNDYFCSQYIAYMKKISLKLEEMDIRCSQHIKEHRAKEMTSKIEKDNEKERGVFRNHLAPRVKSSILRDFLTMRY